MTTTLYWLSISERASDPRGRLIELDPRGNNYLPAPRATLRYFKPNLKHTLPTHLYNYPLHSKSTILHTKTPYKTIGEALRRS